MKKLIQKNRGNLFSVILFTKKNIYEAVWEDYFAADEDIINAHISNIRRKIKNKTTEEYIETLWGIGYRLNKDLNL